MNEQAEMPVFTIDPLQDARWPQFLCHHSRATVFHDPRWLKALWLTYGDRPFVLTTSGPGEPLRNGLVFCEVRSWLTGERLVSLPFSDHCDLLTDSPHRGTELLTHLGNALVKDIRYAEIRPLNQPEFPPPAGWREAEPFCFHILPLDSPQDELFKNLHKDCIQRKIRRAKRENLEYCCGRSELLMQQFYSLVLRTRIRHCLPPQPPEWFANLVACMGEALTIRVALKDGRPIAAILTLSHKNTITYKYGCSDERFNNLGGTPFLFWKTIQEARNEGMLKLDLGRSEITNTGLIAFKDRLGAKRTISTYWRCNSKPARQSRTNFLASAVKRIGPHIPISLLQVPSSLLVATGRLFYRHMD
jgi:hypothetical protein